MKYWTTGKYWITGVLFALLSTQVLATESGVVSIETAKPEPKVFSQLYQALEARKLWVVFTANIGSTLEDMKGRLGDNYNRNHLKAIQSLVVCNAMYANEVSNLDPTMLALCPMRVTVIWQNGKTRMLFARPSLQAQGSPALPFIKNIENEVIAAMQQVAGH